MNSPIKSWIISFYYTYRLTVFLTLGMVFAMALADRGLHSLSSLIFFGGVMWLFVRSFHQWWATQRAFVEHPTRKRLAQLYREGKPLLTTPPKNAAEKEHLRIYLQQQYEFMRHDQNVFVSNYQGKPEEVSNYSEIMAEFHDAFALLNEEQSRLEQGKIEAITEQRVPIDPFGGFCDIHYRDGVADKVGLTLSLGRYTIVIYDLVQRKGERVTVNVAVAGKSFDVSVRRPGLNASDCELQIKKQGRTEVVRIGLW